MNQDEDKEEDKHKDEDEDEDEDSLLTSKEPFRMITKLIIAEFTVLKKMVMDGWKNRWTDRQIDGRTN